MPVAGTSQRRPTETSADLFNSDEEMRNSETLFSASMDDKMNAIPKGIQQLHVEHAEILKEVRELKAAAVSDQQANQLWRRQMVEEVNGITRNLEVNDHRWVQYAFVAGLAKSRFVHTLQGLPKLC